MQESYNAIEINHLSKKFPGVLALDDINLAIKKGEVHVLVGENGAGKSSLVKVISGVYKPDMGNMVLAGKPYTPQTPHDAIESGIRVVYQEFNLLSYLSIAENIYFEKLPRRSGIVNFNELYKKAEDLLTEVGLNISPKTKVEQLGIAQLQLVEIAKALSADSQILIMDEPTATLTSNEIKTLFKIIKRLKAKGVTIIYISHRLQEVFEIGDRITILRNGKKVCTSDVKDLTITNIVSKMVGRKIGTGYPFHEKPQPGAEILRVENLRHKESTEEINFSLKKGELLGIAGLVGSGRTETMRAIFGADQKISGKVFLEGKEISIKSPRDAVNNGICLLTEDRKSQGLILEMPCFANITLANITKVSKRGILDKILEKREAQKKISELRIKTHSVEQLVGNLSGGNQQKVVLAKWLFRDTKVLIFDEPTRGIDVGAKFEIYALLWDLAAKGMGVIIVSSDLPEVIGLCHRILVFSNNKITGDIPRSSFDQEKILSLAYQEYIRERI